MLMTGVPVAAAICITPLSAPINRFRAGDDIGQLRQGRFPDQVDGRPLQQFQYMLPVVFRPPDQNDLSVIVVPELLRDCRKTLREPATSDAVAATAAMYDNAWSIVVCAAPRAIQS